MGEKKKWGCHSGTSLWAAPKPASPGNGRCHLTPDSRWAEGLCALVTLPSRRAWTVLFAATSVPARLVIVPAGRIFRALAPSQPVSAESPPACHQGSQMMLSSVGYFIALPFSKNIFLRINLESNVTTKHHIHRVQRDIGYRIRKYERLKLRSWVLAWKTRWENFPACTNVHSSDWITKFFFFWTQKSLGNFEGSFTTSFKPFFWLAGEIH